MRDEQFAFWCGVKKYESGIDEKYNKKITQKHIIVFCWKKEQICNVYCLSSFIHFLWCFFLLEHKEEYSYVSKSIYTSIK